MSPTENNGYFCGELEALQKFGYKGSINYRSALGSEEAPLLPECRMSMGYQEGIFRVSVDVSSWALGYLECPGQGN